MLRIRGKPCCISTINYSVKISVFSAAAAASENSMMRVVSSVPTGSMSSLILWYLRRMVPQKIWHPRPLNRAKKAGLFWNTKSSVNKLIFSYNYSSNTSVKLTQFNSIIHQILKEARLLWYTTFADLLLQIHFRILLQWRWTWRLSAQTWTVTHAWRLYQWARWFSHNLSTDLKQMIA